MAEDGPAETGTSHRQPPVIGILGGIASGKSFIAEEFRRRGAIVLSADEAGHEVLRQPEIEQAARERWGAAIFGSDGRIVRSKLAKIVFAPAPGGPGELFFLEQLTHPQISEKLISQLNRLRTDSNIPAIILDAAVMDKAGWNRFCNYSVFVESPREVRARRARLRGWSQDDFDLREAAQESLDAKRALADVVIDNSGTADATSAHVERIWRLLVGPLPPK